MKTRNKPINASKPVQEVIPPIIVKNETLAHSGEALSQLFTQNFRGKFAFRLQKLSLKVAAALDNLEASRLGLCKQYGTLNEETRHYDFTDENKPIFDQEYFALMATEIELEGIRRITSNDLENAMLSAMLLNQLDWLIVE